MRLSGTMMLPMVTMGMMTVRPRTVGGRGTMRQPLPELLGDERHEGVQQTQAFLQTGVQDRLRGGDAIGVAGTEDGLDGLEIARERHVRRKSQLVGAADQRVDR
jgi:hypothetical protein